MVSRHKSRFVKVDARVWLALIFRGVPTCVIRAGEISESGVAMALVVLLAHAGVLRAGRIGIIDPRGSYTQSVGRVQLLIVIE